MTNRDLAIAGYGSGSAEEDEIKANIQEVWKATLQNERTRMQAAQVLGMAPASLQQLTELPVTVEPTAGAFAGLDVAYAVLMWGGSEVFLGAFKDLLKEELKKRMQSLWTEVLSPALRQRMGHQRLGDEVDLDNAG